MQIITQFKVGEFTQIRHEKAEKQKCLLLKIMEIKTVTCYAGTQNFYYGRLYYGEKTFRDEEWTLKNEIHHGHTTGWVQYREDELIKVSVILINRFDLYKENI